MIIIKVTILDFGDFRCAQCGEEIKKIIRRDFNLTSKTDRHSVRAPHFLCKNGHKLPFPGNVDKGTKYKSAALGTSVAARYGLMASPGIDDD